MTHRGHISEQKTRALFTHFQAQSVFLSPCFPPVTLTCPMDLSHPPLLCLAPWSFSTQQSDRSLESRSLPWSAFRQVRLGSTLHSLFPILACAAISYAPVHAHRPSRKVLDSQAPSQTAEPSAPPITASLNCSFLQDSNSGHPLHLLCSDQVGDLVMGPPHASPCVPRCLCCPHPGLLRQEQRPESPTSSEQLFHLLPQPNFPHNLSGSKLFSNTVMLQIQ